MKKIAVLVAGLGLLVNTGSVVAQDTGGSKDAGKKVTKESGKKATKTKEKKGKKSSGGTTTQPPK